MPAEHLHHSSCRVMKQTTKGESAPPDTEDGVPPLKPQRAAAGEWVAMFADKAHSPTCSRQGTQLFLKRVRMVQPVVAVHLGML